MDDQRSDTPWYLTDRARWLSYVYLTQDESVRVDDVSDLDIGIDLFVRPGAGRGEESWKMGVVTRGAMSLPEETEEMEWGFRIPGPELDLRPASALRQMPVLLAYYTMSDDQGYGTLLLDNQKVALITGDEVRLTTASSDGDVCLFRLDDEVYHHVVDSGVHRFLSLWADEGVLTPGWEEQDPERASTKARRSDFQVVTSLFSTGTSQAGRA
jgi:hypothetical protein